MWRLIPQSNVSNASQEPGPVSAVGNLPRSPKTDSSLLSVPLDPSSADQVGHLSSSQGRVHLIPLSVAADTNQGFSGHSRAVVSTLTAVSSLERKDFEQALFTKLITYLKDKTAKFLRQMLFIYLFIGTGRNLQLV